MIHEDLECAMWDEAAEVSGAGAGQAVAQASPSPGDSAAQAEAKRQLAADLKKLGATLASWFADIDPSAHFLGLPIAASSGRVAGVHGLLRRRLALVEQRLMQELGTSSLAECARQLNVYSVHGLRLPKPATGAKGGVSMHCFGLAIDVNYLGNPFLQNGSQAAAVVERATHLVSGTAVNVLSPPIAGDAGKTWDRLHRASDDLVAYFQLRKAANLTRLGTLAGRSAHDVSWWRARIAEDYKLLNQRGAFVGRDPQRGFLDLDRRLVRALVETGGLLWGGMYQGGKDLMHFDWRGPGKHRDDPKSWLQVGAPPTAPRVANRADARGDGDIAPPGRTIYAPIPLGQDHARVRGKDHKLVSGPLFTLPARTGIFIPERAKLSGSVDVIVYLHGFLTNVCGRNKTPGQYDQIDDYWKNPYFLLREGLNRTGRDFVLIAPSLGPHAQAGSLKRRGGFDGYMKDVMAAIGARDIGHIILAGHSAGGATMRAIATGSDAYARKIRECWGFDCLYDGSDPAAWTAWATRNPQARLYVYYTATAGTKEHSAQLAAHKLANVAVEQAQIVQPRNPHCQVPLSYWQRRIRVALRQPGSLGATGSSL